MEQLGSTTLSQAEAEQTGATEPRCLVHCGVVPAQQGAERDVEQDAELRRATPGTAASLTAAAVPASRARLTALPGGLSGGTRTRAAAQEPAKRPGDKPARQPAPARPARPARPSRPAQPAEKPSAPSPQPQPKAPSPSRRPIPTPGEVFPPKRKPGPPANPGEHERQRLAAG